MNSQTEVLQFYQKDIPTPLFRVKFASQNNHFVEHPQTDAFDQKSKHLHKTIDAVSSTDQKLQSEKGESEHSDIILKKKKKTKKKLKQGTTTHFSLQVNAKSSQQ